MIQVFSKHEAGFGLVSGIGSFPVCLLGILVDR